MTPVKMMLTGAASVGKKNRLRRKQAKNKRKILHTETATKAHTMIGVGPVEIDSIRKHMKNHKDLENAKGLAVKDHLIENYDFTEEEVE